MRGVRFGWVFWFPFRAETNARRHVQSVENGFPVFHQEPGLGDVPLGPWAERGIAKPGLLVEDRGAILDVMVPERMAVVLSERQVGSFLGSPEMVR